MGFLDKVKAMKNAITGGAAKVQIDLPTVVEGEPFEINVRVDVDSADIKHDRIYLLVEAVEEVEIPDVDVTYDNDGESCVRRELVRASCTTMELDLTVTESGVLEAGQSYEWSIPVEIPEDMQPPFTGHYSRHYYRAFAGIDMFGNDPDSGWQELNFI